MPPYLTPLNAIYALWAFWVVSWHIAMIWTSRVVHADVRATRYLLLALTIIGVAMMFWIVKGPLGAPLWQLPEPLAWGFAALTAVGIAFMWWARVHLGKLWSGAIVTREGHRVIDTGPYRLVRHPIYAGLFLAAISLAVVKATMLALAGCALAIIAFVAKAQAEEMFLLREMGAAYADYRRRVPMLIPFWPP